MYGDEMPDSAERPAATGAVSPNFLIIGAEKAGTTFLHDALQRHTDVFMPPEEIPFFEDPDYGEPGALQEFSKLFQPGAGKRAIGLMRPNYLHKPECPARIHKHFPDAKLIVMLRDPVERAISAYNHNVLNRFAPLRRPESGIRAIIDQRLQERYPRSQEVIEFGFYYRDLKRYLELFPREQILVMLMEDLRSDAHLVQRRALQFLGLDTAHVPPLPRGRVNEGEYAMARLALLRLRSRLLYRYNDERTRLWRKQRVGRASAFALACIERVARRLQRTDVANNGEVVSPQLRRRLAELYIDDTLRLEKLLGLDLSHWWTRRALA
ncbi:MAG TPA: sulfotransferase [Stellaceae bacterium]|nr:sulfotransferase [Stellaceae bacterium]